jgi:hypothetical protein
LNAKSEKEREYEQSDRVTDDIVAQQRRGDDPGGELPTRDLERDQQRTERKHEKGQCRRCGGLK